jgi:hypothetical protein
LLKEMSQDEITTFMKALISAECIKVQEGVYPTVGLTDFGREVMLGQQEVLLNLPE